MSFASDINICDILDPLPMKSWADSVWVNIICVIARDNGSPLNQGDYVDLSVWCGHVGTTTITL